MKEWHAVHDGQLYNHESSRRHETGFIASGGSLSFQDPKATWTGKTLEKKESTGETQSFSWARDRHQLEMHRQLRQRRFLAGGGRCTTGSQRSLRSEFPVVLGKCFQGVKRLVGGWGHLKGPFNIFFAIRGWKPACKPKELEVVSRPRKGN